MERFAAKVRERGSSVYLAQDGAEAIAHILNIARQRGAKMVAKSKSLTSEEIDINVRVNPTSSCWTTDGPGCGTIPSFTMH